MVINFGFNHGGQGLLGGGALLLRERHAAGRAAEEVQAALAEHERPTRAAPLDPVAEADFPRVLPVLDAARDLPHGAGRSWLDALGLGQDAKLAAGARAAYRNALERVMLPRLVWRLGAQMRANPSDPAYLYEATRVHLMLGGAGPLDRDLVRAWMEEDWRAVYPGASAEPLRAALLGHLDALLSGSLPPVELGRGGTG